MNKTAFIFPGQGAQYYGMGKDFYECFSSCRQVYEKAAAATGLDVAALCFTENEQLNQTEYTQIAILTTEAAILKRIGELDIRADVCAGLSLGEYGALIATGCLRMEDAFKLIRQRGILMQNSYPTGGAMSAVLGLDAERIEQICEAAQGIVSVANYNCPGQSVITGEASAVAAAGEALKNAGAKRIVPLKVSGPFHSVLMEQAGNGLKAVLEEVELHDLQIPYVPNVTAQYCTGKETVKELLIRQVSSSVRWQQSIESMIQNGVDTFIEIGPGKTLSGFLKKINPAVNTLNISEVSDLEQFIK